MAKFHDVIGYGISTETKPDVWEDVITEKTYRGDVLRFGRRLVNGQGLNDDVTGNNYISVLADVFAYENEDAIRYIKWRGKLWKLSNVEIQRPRLLLTPGGLYNGPTPAIVDPTP